MAMFPFLTSPIKSYLKTSLLWRSNGFSAEFASYAPQPHRNVEIPGQDRCVGSGAPKTECLQEGRSVEAPSAGAGRGAGPKPL